MPKCSFCGESYEIPRGLTLILVDGTIKHLCSSKCRKNMLMKRRKIRWVSKGKKTKEEALKEVLAEVKEEKKVEAPVDKAEEKSAKVDSKEEKKEEVKKE